MIYRLEIENFYSILDKQVIDLRIPANVPDIPGRFAPICAGAKERAPKVAVLFGANAAGKSNVLKAIAFVGWFVKDSFSELKPESAIPYSRFNSDAGADRPTGIAIEFSGPKTITRNRQHNEPYDHLYRYSIQFANSKDRASKVQYEALHRKPITAKRMSRVFERFDDGTVKSTADFGLSGYRQVIGTVRSNASLIATLAQFGHEPSSFLRRFAGSVSSNLLMYQPMTTPSTLLQPYADDPDLLELTNYEIQRLDLGIERMEILDTQRGKTARFHHVGLSEPIVLELESQGTLTFLEVFPFIAVVLNSGGVAAVDELDTTIHPMILLEILRWFHDPDRDEHVAQLWTTCQNASLLEELEKEEIFFCEKSWSGATQIYGLKDITGVTRRENYYRRYLSGMFGAVPHVG